jgi:hypothetical protein
MLLPRTEVSRYFIRHIQTKVDIPKLSRKGDILVNVIHSKGLVVSIIFDLVDLIIIRESLVDIPLFPQKC